ncbi:MAG: hypothetical protein ACR2JB_20795 [Bryobacteraceae bacterium]
MSGSLDASIFPSRVANPHNRRIVDLENAVNLTNGKVEFSSDFIAIRPKDTQMSNRSLLLEVPNPGVGRIIALVDGGDSDVANDAGDAWLLRQGYTVVTLGWQWDATGQDALRLYAPIAREGGKTITGLLRGDLMPPVEKRNAAAKSNNRFRVARAGGFGARGEAMGRVVNDDVATTRSR